MALQPIVIHQIKHRRILDLFYGWVARDFHLSDYSTPSEKAAKVLVDGFSNSRLRPGPLRVLELGCGNGKSSTKVLAEFLSVSAPRSISTLHGVDVSQQMITVAKQQIYPSNVAVDFSHADMLDHLESVAPQSHDAIVSFGLVPWHVRRADYSRLYALAKRALKPDGLMMHEIYVDDLVTRRQNRRFEEARIAAGLAAKRRRWTGPLDIVTLQIPKQERWRQLRRNRTPALAAR